MSLVRERERLHALTRADVAAHVRAGWMNRDIVRRLGVAPAVVTAVREQLGAPANSAHGFRPSSLEDAFWGQVRHIPDGHLLWLGGLDPDGGPCFQHGPHVYAARRVAYQLGHRRDPDGPATPACGHDRCVEPHHLVDQPQRRYLVSVLTALFGDTRS
ncbi:hypothetical protein [Streptomyces cylindrosporus]|uniref:Uncharacterized protein n=1 Tax=Streptomyces cylindrosporus TaxID=2927583 RepID=A0ABS9YKY7_9ACTN|nr:hypothetical protein [Streptomyces cylindrosporus]MCI3277574.1 hypothetical protein [Streptomyces cylindrosporus]